MDRIGRVCDDASLDGDGLTCSLELTERYRVVAQTLTSGCEVTARFTN